MAKRTPKDSGASQAARRVPKNGAPPEKDGEGYQFTPPSFKEDEFYKREIRNAWFSVSVLCLAVIGAIFAFVALFFVGLTAGFAAGMFAGAGIALVPRILKAEYADFRWTIYFWNSVSYIAWIVAFMLVVSNPPFMDLTAPAVTGLQWSMDGAEWYSASTVIYIGNNTTQTVYLRVRAVDNADRDLNVTIKVGSMASTTMTPQSDGYRFNHTCILRQGTYEVFVTTDDSASDTWFGSDDVHDTTATWELEVKEGFPPS